MQLISNIFLNLDLASSQGKCLSEQRRILKLNIYIVQTEAQNTTAAILVQSPTVRFIQEDTNGVWQKTIFQIFNITPKLIDQI